MKKRLILMKPAPEDAPWMKGFTVGKPYLIKRKATVSDERARYAAWVIDDDFGYESLIYSRSIFKGSDWQFQPVCQREYVDRDAAVEEIAKIIEYRNGCSQKSLAGWLYDAGYRKVE